MCHRLLGHTFQILYSLKNRVKKLLDLRFINTGKRNAQVFTARGDQADTVFVKYVFAQGFGINRLKADTHEIT